MAAMAVEASRLLEGSGLSLVVGLSVAEALDPEAQHLGLKWPNDLWVSDGSHRKLGAAVAQLLDGIDTFKTRVARVQNRALFEVPQILASLLANAGSAVPDGFAALGPLLHPAALERQQLHQTAGHTAGHHAEADQQMDSGARLATVRGRGTLHETPWMGTKP
jgi:hypothetical protein